MLVDVSPDGEDGTVEAAVDAILNEECPGGVPPVVEAAIAAGRVQIINRDHANDDFEPDGADD